MGEPQVSKLGGTDMLLLPTFTTHPAIDAIQGASREICLNSGECSMNSVSEVEWLQTVGIKHDIKQVSLRTVISIQINIRNVFPKKSSFLLKPPPHPHNKTYWK